MVSAEMKILETTTGQFQRLAALNRVLSGLLREQALESRLRVVNYPARAMLAVDINAIADELVKLRSQLRLFVEMTGDGHQLAAARIADTLTANGFLLSDQRETADAVISGNIHTQPLALNNPRAEFVRATAIVNVVETGSGATFATFNADIRKGHVDPAEAGRRAVLQLADIMAERLMAAIGLDGGTPGN
jgi:hypothetical protein